MRTRKRLFRLVDRLARLPERKIEAIKDTLEKIPNLVDKREKAASDNKKLP